MRRVVVGFVAVATLLLGMVPVLASNTWAEYHWADGDDDPHNGAITLTLVDALTAPYEFSTVKADWVSAGPLTLSSSTGSPLALACQNRSSEAAATEIAGTIHVCNAKYSQNGWLGLARIWLSPDGHIDAAVALMNDSYLFESGSTYNNPTARRHVFCQEVGHTFGLDHQKGPKKQSCMNDRWGLTNPEFKSPNQHDWDTLSEIYGPVADGGGDGDDPKPCNTNRPNCPGGSNVHVAPRAGGGWIVTFTIPAGR